MSAQLSSYPPSFTASIVSLFNKAPSVITSTVNRAVIQIISGTTQVKKLANTKIPVDIKQRLCDRRRVCMHTLPSSGSKGQGNLAVRQLTIPATTIITNAKSVIEILYCDRVIKKGATLIKLAKVAPAPKVTNTAGNAQQIKVDVEANKEK